MTPELKKGHKVMMVRMSPGLTMDDEGELERRGIRFEKEAEQESIWMRLCKYGICQRLFTQLDTSSALTRHETEKFSMQQKNKPGILALRCQGPNFV